MFKYKTSFHIDITKFFENKDKPNGKQIEKEKLEYFIFSLCKVKGFRLKKYDSVNYGLNSSKDKFIFEVLHNSLENKIDSLVKKYDFLNLDSNESFSKKEIEDMNIKSKNRKILQKF